MGVRLNFNIGGFLSYLFGNLTSVAVVDVVSDIFNHIGPVVIFTE